MNKVNLLTIFLGFMAFVAYTQPNGFNYQAIARESNGEAMKNKPLTVNFSISTTKTGTPQIWCETHNVRTTEFGIFTLTVGSETNNCGNKTPLKDLDWKTGEFYLTVKIGDDPPSTQQLLTVPYAFYAKSAAIAETVLNSPSLTWNNTTRELSLTGNPTKVVITGSGPTTVSTDNTSLTGNGVSPVLSISNGGVSTEKIAAKAVDETKLAAMGATTNGQVLKWNGAAWKAGDDAWTTATPNIYRASGNVGIGLTTPSDKLHISKGNMRIDDGIITIKNVLDKEIIKIQSSPLKDGLLSSKDNGKIIINNSNGEEKMFLTATNTSKTGYILKGNQ
jgi:hypothetical protein